MSSKARTIIKDGDHCREAIKVLGAESIPQASLLTIVSRAEQILQYAVDPLGGPVAPSYGLLYGLIQSGKTSVIAITTAMAIDNGFRCVIILTSDINLLYSQTLHRIKTQLPGLHVLAKADWNNPRFEQQLRTYTPIIVCSKNAKHLNGLFDALARVGARGARGLQCLIIDDEADQASLNTLTSKGSGDLSAVNESITKLRHFFDVNTYLQVTATPQALFLQVPQGLYRPSFTVLSEPGDGYVGGEEFFGITSQVLRYVEIEEVDDLRVGGQPHQNLQIPRGLKEALFSFLIGATNRELRQASERSAFLCHISHEKVNHSHVIGVIEQFREKCFRDLRNTDPTSVRWIDELRQQYDDLAKTEDGIASFEEIVKRIKFLIQGMSVKEINSTSDVEIELDHVYNVFVGGNKLGRGVTIPSLITSYYGRNPKRPNADTVLQHARMYGYRRRDLGVTRLFLPTRLADHFRAIHQMENALRDLIKRAPEGKFEGIYIESPLQATRRNVLDPNSIGLYVAGRSYNPRYPLRTVQNDKSVKEINSLLSTYDPRASKGTATTVDAIIEILAHCKHDPEHGADLWNLDVLREALLKVKLLFGNDAEVLVRHNRKLDQAREETQGILSGGEVNLVNPDRLALFMFRLEQSDRGNVAWWPQLRFPNGNYAMAFSFER